MQSKLTVPFTGSKVLVKNSMRVVSGLSILSIKAGNCEGSAKPTSRLWKMRVEKIPTAGRTRDNLMADRTSMIFQSIFTQTQKYPNFERKRLTTVSNSHVHFPGHSFMFFFFFSTFCHKHSARLGLLVRIKPETISHLVSQSLKSESPLFALRILESMYIYWEGERAESRMHTRRG